MLWLVTAPNIIFILDLRITFLFFEGTNDRLTHLSIMLQDEIHLKIMLVLALVSSTTTETRSPFFDHDIVLFKLI
jgi:hypothetical protein